MSEEANEQHIT